MFLLNRVSWILRCPLRATVNDMGILIWKASLMEGWLHKLMGVSFLGNYFDGKNVKKIYFFGKFLAIRISFLGIFLMVEMLKNFLFWNFSRTQKFPFLERFLLWEFQKFPFLEIFPQSKCWELSFLGILIAKNSEKISKKGNFDGHKCHIISKKGNISMAKI